MIRRRPRSAALGTRAVLFVALAVLGAACGDDDQGADKAATTATAPATSATAARLTGDITVLAAASLTESFSEVGKAFETANPGVRVKFSFDSSSTLARQANSGAPADLFASADDVNMKKVTDASNASGPKTFARNRLAVVVQKGNPKGISRLSEFGRSDVIYVLCALPVPCGNYGEQALGRVGVTRAPASYEANVKGVVTKVTTGQADAGIVYVTDAKAAARSADGIDIPDDQNVAVSYPVVVLKRAPHADVAWAFMNYLLSPQGQATLAKYGFLPAT